jgi:RNA polymerase sigma-70 factor (sigma-E family)
MSPRSDDDERFHVFVARSTAPLTRLAYLLCGDQHLANDLVQTCLVRLYQAWPRIRDRESVESYARKALLRCWLNERRRPWRQVEWRTAEVPDRATPVVSDPASAAYRTEVLRTALSGLPPRQRAAVVLRYWSQHSVAETAAILRCTEGTVKSQSARGLATLRAALDQLGALEELKS